MTSYEKQLNKIKEELKKEDKLLQESLDYYKKHLDKLWEYAAAANERLQDLEIQVHVLTRLLINICIEYLGMRTGHFRRLIKKAEKETVADSQIQQLEKLFYLEHREKKNH